MKLNLIRAASAAFLLFAIPFGASHAAPSAVIWNDLAFCDPYIPTNCARPNADGSLNFTSSTGGSAVNPSRSAEVGSSTAADGIVPSIAGSAASSQIIKASPGNLYGVYATCTAACWLMVFNATTAPADGATTAGTATGNLQDCVSIPSGTTGSISYGAGPGEVFSTGITAVISSTACATKTAAATGFIHGSAR